DGGTAGRARRAGGRTVSPRPTIEELRAQLPLLPSADERTAQHREADRIGRSLFGEQWPAYLAALVAVHRARGAAP
ncbi:MAG: hypothetical protein JWL95_23, partial [Gemmatimonadetes bacterium]|nr:hypothetical protein [Gemmatimonadota bacterium]